MDVPRNFRGEIAKGDGLILIAVPKLSSTYNYISNNLSSVTSPLFIVVAKKISNQLKLLLTSELENVIPRITTEQDRNYFTTFDILGDNVLFPSIIKEGFNITPTSLSLTLSSEYNLDESVIYSGANYKLDTEINVRREYDSYPGTNLERPSLITNVPSGKYSNSILESDSVKINNVNFSLSSTATTISLTGFGITLAQASEIPFSGYLTITDGINTEYIIYEYFDKEIYYLSGCRRGSYGSTPLAFVNDNVSIQFRMFNSQNNFVSSSSLPGFIDSLDFICIPRDEKTYMSKVYNISYEHVKFLIDNTFMKYYNNKGTLTSHYPPNVTVIQALLGKFPNHSSITGKFFTTPLEAKNDYHYSYCRNNETCGKCKGKTLKQGTSCLSRNDTSTTLTLTEEPKPSWPSQTNSSDWNKNNQRWNRDFPIIITCVIVVIFIISWAVMGTSLRSGNIALRGIEAGQNKPVPPQSTQSKSTQPSSSNPSSSNPSS